MKLPPNLSPQQESIVRQYADDFSGTVQPIYKSEQQAARELGIQVEDTTSLWGHRYLNRAQAGKGNAAGTAQYQRTGLIKDLPGGQDQFEQLAINPQFSGIATRKAAGQAYDGAAIQAAIDQNAKIIAQDIIAEANQQIPTMRQYGLKVPQRAMDIATNANGAADDHAREVSTYLARLQPDVAERGMFYRQDLGTNAMAYGTNFAAKKAVRTGALNVLAKEGKDLDMLLTKATNASDVVNLKAALDELKMTGAEAELVNRIPGMNSVVDLASRAVVAAALVAMLEQEKVARPYVGLVHALPTAAAGLAVFTIRGQATESFFKAFVELGMLRRYVVRVAGAVEGGTTCDAGLVLAPSGVWRAARAVDREVVATKTEWVPRAKSEARRCAR